MIFFGFLGNRKVKTADDFATARNAYGPIFLAFAFAASLHMSKKLGYYDFYSIIYFKQFTLNNLL